MKTSTYSALAALAFALTSCATPKPEQAFQDTDKTAVVIESFGSKISQMVRPTTSARQSNDATLTEAKALPQRKTVVIILENYTEQQIGSQYRDRGTSWFVSLRMLGYKHLVFIRGNGNANPDGLPILVEYD